MIRRLRLLREGTFVRNVAIVATGTAGAQLIGIAFTPIITRLYGPEPLGILGVFMAATEVLVPVAALAYPIAIVLPEADSDARALVQLSLLISILLAGLLTLTSLFFQNSIIDLFGLHSISGFFLLLPLFMVFAVWINVGQQWLIRKKMFAITARVNITQAAVVNGAKVGLGWINPSAVILVSVTLFGRLLYAILLTIGMNFDLSRMTDDFMNSINRMKNVARRYRDFPFYRAPQAFINKLSHGLPVLMLAMFFSPASAGFYSIARTALALPSILIGKSVSDVFYPRFTEADRQDEDRFSILLRANLALAGVGLLPFSVVIIFGPWLFAIVFGQEWVNAGEYARWLSLWMYFVFINPPNLSAIAVMRMQRFYLIYEIISIALRVLALLSGYLLFTNDLFAVGAFSVVGAGLNIFLILITLYRAKNIARMGVSHPTPID